MKPTTKKYLKRTVIILLSLPVLLIGGGVAWVQATWSLDHPDTPRPALKSSSDPEVIARGEYVVHAVAHCSSCHQPGHLTRARKLDVTQPLSGGFIFEAGPFGNFVAANITPHATGIGNMSDPDLARAIRHSVGPEGTLLPFMRVATGPLSDEDLVAVMSYLRTQKPVDAKQPPDEPGFVAKALSSKFTPRMAAAPTYVPPGAISVERGRYLAEGPALCLGCHSPLDPMQGFALAGPPFSGTAEADPDPTDETQEIISPNLTPHAQFGHIAKWTEDNFVQRFRAGRVFEGSKMPWEAFARMTEADLRSIYRFLRTVKPAAIDRGPTRRDR